MRAACCLCVVLRFGFTRKCNSYLWLVCVCALVKPHRNRYREMIHYIGVAVVAVGLISIYLYFLLIFDQIRFAQCLVMNYGPVLSVLLSVVSCSVSRCVSIVQVAMGSQRASLSSVRKLGMLHYYLFSRLTTRMVFT